MRTFDIIVIGSGPAGQRAAIQGAKCGRRVAVIEQREIVGGACVNTGTIPSKTMREAVMHLSGFQYRASTALIIPSRKRSPWRTSASGLRR